MFTGIIQAIGDIQSREQRDGDACLVVNTGKLDMASVSLGDSIAVNGVCLTAVDFSKNSFSADVSNESLSRTTLGKLKTGSSVNLEMAVTPTTHLGGHLVSGHVDGVGEVMRRWDDARSERFAIRAPEGLAKYIAEKGSICLDGISLTVNAVAGCEFELNIVPHTLDSTTMGEYKVGQQVNLEVDIIARYLERLMLGEEAAKPEGGVTMSLLAERGFLK